MTNSLIEKLQDAAHTEVFHGSGAQRSIALDKAIAIVRQHEAESIKHATGESENKTIWEKISKESDKHHGSLKSLPTDLSSEHDHYIYGTPKRGGQDASNNSLGSRSSYTDGTCSREYEERPEPTQISLERCARAAARWRNGKKLAFPDFDALSASEKAAHRDQAKAVLEAAGVPYAD